jgi:hypothetical protein
MLAGIGKAPSGGPKPFGFQPMRRGVNLQRGCYAQTIAPANVFLHSRGQLGILFSILLIFFGI